MSQKRKKKNGHNQRRQTELAATIQPTTAPTAPIPPVSVVATASTAPAASHGAAPSTEADAQLMRRDLVKVAIVLIIVVGVLVALVLTNRSTGWLDHIAGELYRWLRLG